MDLNDDFLPFLSVVVKREIGRRRRAVEKVLCSERPWTSEEEPVKKAVAATGRSWLREDSTAAADEDKRRRIDRRRTGSDLVR